MDQWKVMDMSHENATEAMPTNPTEEKTNGPSAGSNGQTFNHAADEQIAYDPVPLHFRETLRVRVRHIGKLPVAPFPVEE